MSTLTDLPAVDTVIPDGIEPVEAWRCWRISADGALCSLHNDAVWTPGAALQATCGCEVEHKWSVVRHGITGAEATLHAQRVNVTASNYWLKAGQRAQRANATAGNYWIPRTTFSLVPDPPRVELPAGWGFALESETHPAPAEACTCGIYAVTSANDLPAGGTVYGKVKLWGKIVPGELGVRAEYAYPSEFHVPPGLADNPTLRAFGVPIVVSDTGDVTRSFSEAASTRRMPGPLRVAIALNYAAAGTWLTLFVLKAVS